MDRLQLKPKIAVSSCVLGENVRWNGTNSTSHWVDSELNKHVDIVSFCPEMAMGLGTPRPPIRLVRQDGGLRLQESDGGRDHTSAAEEALKNLLPKLSSIDGLILKAKSPSCGMDRVKVYNSKNNVQEHTAGYFASALKNSYPDIPIIDDGRIHDDSLRLNFLNRVFIHFRFKNLERKISQLQEFHKNHKFLFMGYSQDMMRQLGRIAASVPAVNTTDQAFTKYYHLMNQMLERNIKKSEMINSLGHLLGYFKNLISSEEKKHLLNLIEEYRNHNFPSTSIIEIFNYLCTIHDVGYIKDQKVLMPFPKSLQFARTK